MPELLTSREAARYLRLSERKLYELVSEGTVPCTKVTGRWLFPRAALDRWVLSGLLKASAFAHTEAPPIVGGSQDSLLELALRESRCGLALLPEGSQAGIERLVRGEAIAVGCHLHRLEGDDEQANPETVAATPGLHDAVVIAFARREQGLVVERGNRLGLTDISTVARKRARIAQRQGGAGAQLLLMVLLAHAGLKLDELNVTREQYATGPDLAQAIRAGHADCGIATRSAANVAGLDFVSLTWERYDLVMRQRDYFRPSLQTLFEFIRSPSFANRADELGGYDVKDTGKVRLIN